MCRIAAPPPVRLVAMGSMQRLAVMKYNTPLLDEGQRLFLQIDQLRRRHQVVRFPGHRFVRNDPTFVRAVNVTQAPILLAHVIKGYPGSDYTVAGVALEIEIVLMVRLGRTETRRFHENLIAGQQWGRPEQFGQ